MIFEACSAIWVSRERCCEIAGPSAKLGGTDVRRHTGTQVPVEGIAIAGRDVEQG